MPGFAVIGIGSAKGELIISAKWRCRTTSMPPSPATGRSPRFEPDLSLNRTALDEPLTILEAPPDAVWDPNPDAGRDALRIAPDDFQPDHSWPSEPPHGAF